MAFLPLLDSCWQKEQREEVMDVTQVPGRCYNTYCDSSDCVT